MGTGIEWTDATWNPMTGCQKISEGCRWCYADTMSKRLQGNYRKLEGEGTPIPAGIKRYRDGFAPAFHPDALGEPLRWKKPRRVFVCSMSDLFHTSFSFEQIAAVFGVMAACPQHQFQVLTKRPERMKAWFEWVEREHVFYDPAGKERGWKIGSLLCDCSYKVRPSPDCHVPLHGHGNTPWPLPNVWVGVTVENQAAADERIPLLLETPAAVRFLSCEPLIGPVDLDGWLPGQYSCLHCGYVGEKTGDQETCEECGSVFPPPGKKGEMVPCGCGSTSYLNSCPRCGASEGGGFGTYGSEGLSPTPTVLDWVIAGGESGPKARPSHPDWFRTLRDQCQAAGVPFFFKQWGQWMPDFDSKTFKDGRRSFRWGDFIMHSVGKKKAGRELDGRTWEEYPYN
ncbi:phage Gp37/Gp68 family protein [bacterium]|nr:phage Gp37/Gp68 family protein [bacterium]